MPIDLTSTSSAANRRDVLDIAPRSSEPVRRSEPTPRTDRNDSQRAQHDRSDDARRDVSSARKSEKTHDTHAKDNEPSDFEKSLQEGAQQVEKESKASTETGKNEGQQQVDPQLVEGEIAIDLLLPAALGPEAVGQVQLDIAEEVADPALAAAVAQVATDVNGGQEDVEGEGLLVINDEGNLLDSIAAVSDQVTVNTGEAEEQQLAVVVKVGGEEVPVTLHVQPKLQQAEEDVAAQQQIQQVAQQVAVETPVDEEGNPLRH